MALCFSELPQFFIFEPEDRPHFGGGSVLAGRIFFLLLVSAGKLIVTMRVLEWRLSIADC
jgi:hypothetical protein